MRKLKDLSFSQAFDMLRRHGGLGMRLPHWGPNTFITIQVTGPKSKMTHPYIYVDSDKGKVPWIATNPELFSMRWESYVQSIDRVVLVPDPPLNEKLILHLFDYWLGGEFEEEIVTGMYDGENFYMLPGEKKIEKRFIKSWELLN